MIRRLRRRPSANFLTVAGPTLLAAALAAWHLGTRSLWLDEGATVAIVSQHGIGLWMAIARDGGNMLGYYLGIHAVVALFGTAEWVIRLPSVVATAVTAGVVTWLGLRLFADRMAGIAAGLLVAVSLPIVFWGQNARGYAAMVCFATISVALFAVLLGDARSGVPVRRRVLAAYGITLWLSLYMGFIAILMIPAELVVLAWFARDRWRWMLGTLVVVGLACLPLLLLALGRGSGQLFWVPSPSSTVLKQAAVTVTSTGMPPNFHVRWLTTPALIFSGALIVAAVLRVALLVRAPRAAAAGGVWAAVLVTSWFLVPLVIGLVLSFAGEPVELARGSVLLIPAVALLLGWGLFATDTPYLLGGALFVALVVVRVFPLVPSYHTNPENWQAAAQAVIGASDGAAGGGCVAFYPEDGRMAFDYYVGHRAARRLAPVLPTEPWRLTRPFVERYIVPDGPRLAQIVRRCPRLWLIASHDGQRRGPPVSRRNYRRYQRLFAYFANAYPVSSRRLFGYAAVIRVVAFSR